MTGIWIVIPLTHTEQSYRRKMACLVFRVVAIVVVCVTLTLAIDFREGHERDWEGVYLDDSHVGSILSLCYDDAEGRLYGKISL